MMIGGTSALDRDRDARMTAEMTKAIRRQESNLDYWRTGNVNSVGATTTINRPTYKKVTQINLNFPGSCLPKASNEQRQNPSKREHPPSTVLLTRSRTSLVPKVMVSSRSQVNPNGSVTPASKKAMVTDLTCLQLADSLFTSKKSPYVGLLDLWQGRSRYTDYFVDGKEEGGTYEGGSDILSDGSRSKQSMLSNTMPRRGTSIPVLHYKTLQPEEEVLHNNNNNPDIRTITPPEGHVSCKSATVWTHNKRDKQNHRPHKSILKNPSDKQCLFNETCKDSSTKLTRNNSSLNFSYKLPTVKDGGRKVPDTEIIVTLDKITPKFDGRPGSSKSDSQSKTNMDYALEGLMRDLPTRKRSVRFNATHEIREYAPCEPVTYS